MKLGTSVRFLFPTSPATHERFRALAPRTVLIELYHSAVPDTGADAYIRSPYSIAEIVTAIGDTTPATREDEALREA